MGGTRWLMETRQPNVGPQIVERPRKTKPYKKGTSGLSFAAHCDRHPGRLPPQIKVKPMLAMLGVLRGMLPEMRVV